MSDNAWGSQLKNNFDLGAGVNVSIPLTDNRQTKTAVNKAKLQKQNYELDLRDKQTTSRQSSTPPSRTIGCRPSPTKRNSRLLR